MPTLTERQAHAHFLKYKRECIKILGRAPTRLVQLDVYGSQVFNNKYIGTFMQNGLTAHDWSRFLTGSKKYLILNTDLKHKNGTHWVAVARSGKSIVIYDSFGRDTKNLIPYFHKRLKNYRLKILQPDRDAEQNDNSAICGCLCIAWLQVFDKYGLRNSLKI